MAKAFDWLSAGSGPLTWSGDRSGRISGQDGPLLLRPGWASRGPPLTWRQSVGLAAPEEPIFCPRNVVIVVHPRKEGPWSLHTGSPTLRRRQLQVVAAGYK
jgi:hypothetical protein